MLGKGHAGLYKASTMEERRKRKSKRRERQDQVSDRLGFEAPVRSHQRLGTNFPVSHSAL